MSLIESSRPVATKATNKNHSLLLCKHAAAAAFSNGPVELLGNGAHQKEEILYLRRASKILEQSPEPTHALRPPSPSESAYIIYLAWLRARASQEGIKYVASPRDLAVQRRESCCARAGRTVWGRQHQQNPS